jgi:hypothetical protein
LPFYRNIPVRGRRVHAADEQAACEMMMAGQVQQAALFSRLW